MPKTIVIDDDAHAVIIQEQSRMKEKYDINLKISYIASYVLRCYGHKIEDILKKEIGGISDQGVAEKIGAD